VLFRSCTDVNPDEVVAMGAALHAASLMAPEQQAFLLDVTPLSLRIGVAGGLAETVIERNTPVPIDQTRTFTTFQDFQESVRIRVYQGESRQAVENELLGEFVFAGFARARRGDVKIEVTFEINSDGIVSVTARDPATDQKASTQITLSSGLREEEIQAILARGHTERVQTPSPLVGDSGPGGLAPAPDEVASADDLEVLPETLPEALPELSPPVGAVGGPGGPAEVPELSQEAALRPGIEIDLDPSVDELRPEDPDNDLLAAPGSELSVEVGGEAVDLDTETVPPPPRRD